MASLLAGGLLWAGIGGQPAVALTVDPAVQAGVQLPLNVSPTLGPVELASVTPGYVAYSRQQDEYVVAQFLIRRTSDGSVARSVIRKPNAPEPYLSESSVVQRQPIPGSEGATRFTVDSIESGNEQWSVDIPTAETVVGAGASWVLTSNSSSGQAILRRPGVAASDVTGVTLSGPTSAGPTAIADEQTLVVHDEGRVWAVDLASGLPTLLTTTAGPYDRLILTPTRVFWVDEGIGTDLATWSSRDGSNPGHVTVSDASTTDHYVGFGNRLAAYHYEANHEAYQGGLRPVDLATGQLDLPVATKVAAAKGLGDGRVAMVLADTPSGRLARIADDGQPAHQLADLPVIGLSTTALALSGDHVVAGFGDAYDRTVGPVLVSPANGSGAWSGMLGAGDETMPGGLVDAAGDAVLTQTATHFGTVDMRVSWPGGHRDLSAVSVSTALARGGKVLVVPTDNGPTRMMDVVSGTPLTTIPAGEQFAVDGMEFWRGPDAGGDLIGTDLNNSAPERRVATGRLGCVDSVPQVTGRFAMIRCHGVYTAVDTMGVLAPWDVPWNPATAAQPKLGNGFVTWTRYLNDPDNIAYAVAEVIDLGPGHGSRLYGPLHGRYSPPNPILAVDDQGGHQIAYVDTTMQVRTVDLGWLSEPPPVQAPPAPAEVTASPGNTQAVVSWTPPATNGGSAITAYTVTASPGGSTVNTTGATTATVTGLANGTSYTFTVSATNDLGTSTASAPSAAVTPWLNGSGFNGITPKRVLDTRIGVGAPKAKVGAGRTVTLTIPGLPAGTTAVALNVTATNPTASSYLTVYPTGAALPTTSNLNFVKGQTIPNMVTVTVGTGGKVTFYNGAGTVDIIADLAGYFRG